MAIKRINPSRNAWDNDNRQNYGYVIRVPKLPDAHKFIVDFIVFNESDNCFYKCVEVNNDTQHYYTWRAVTFGASRAYLIPVGKLTTTDINDATEVWTSKGFVGCIPKTLNEIVFGLRRYHGTTHYPIGYSLATGVFDPVGVAAKEYYHWKWNDTIDSIYTQGIDGEYYTKDVHGNYVKVKNCEDLVLHKHFIGEMYLMTKGTQAQVEAGEADYYEGMPITDEVYTLSIGKEGDEPAWGDITMTDMAAKANEIIERLNQHKADIPLADPTKDLTNLCKVINLMIDEINPFCIPWQLLLNRQNFLEVEVGAVTLQTEGISPELVATRTNLAKWANVEWECFYYLTSDTTYQEGKTYYIRSAVPGAIIPHNFTYTEVTPEPGTEIPATQPTYEKYDFPTELLYGTVVQAVDAALNLIRYKDSVTGRLRDLNEFAIDTGDTLVNWLNRLKLKVDDFYESIVNAKISLKQIHDSIGEVGFVRTRDTTFSATTSTEWPGYYYWDSDKTLFVMVDKDDPDEGYSIGDSISAWEALNGKTLYQFYTTDVARTLIAKNAADILLNKQDVDNLLGTQLKRIYVEKLDSTGDPSITYYYYDRSSSEVDHPFIPFEEPWDTTKDLEYYQKLYNSPIFVPSERNEYIVTNETIARSDTYYYKNAEEEYVALTISSGTDLKAYRTTYGTLYVRKETAAVQIRVNNEEIHRIGHKLYNFKVEIDEAIAEQARRTKRLKQLTGVNGDDEVVSEWVVDGYAEIIKAGQYREYRRYYKLDPTSTDPLKFIEMISGTEAQWEQGYKFILTVDETFRTGVDYYTRTGATEATYVYELATVTPGEAVTPKTYYNKVGVDYVVPYYELTKDVQFEEGKTYYKVNEDGKFVPQIVTPGNEPEENTWYEFHNPTPRPAGGVYIRKARKEHGGYEENNTHRGLIDRNTKDIEDHRQECGNFQKWTKKQLQAIEDFIFSLMLSTLDVITQERSTLSLLHETVGKLITLHNALERLQGNQTMKPAFDTGTGAGAYDSGYDYYMKGEKTRLPDAVIIDPIPGVEFEETSDVTVVEGKIYYNYCVHYALTTDPKFVADKKYYKRSGSGTAVSPYVYTEDTTIVVGKDVTKDTYYEKTEHYVEADVSGTIEHYFLTEDTKFISGKTYYTRTGSGTTADPYVYEEATVVAGGTVTKNTYYEYRALYEMTSGTIIGRIKRWKGYGFFLTKDITFVTAKTYYTRTGKGTVRDPYVYLEYTPTTSSIIPTGTYYEWFDWYKMEPGVDYEIGLEVGQNVYTKDLVIATTENYTINEIRLAVNRVLTYHVDSKELPIYTELPDTEIILESMTYYRYIDGDWEKIVPEEDDPTMIGKRIKDYDPMNKWYINTGTPVPDGSTVTKRYTETPIRMFLNELIKLHRRSTNNNNPMDLAASLILGLNNVPTSSTYRALSGILARR